MKVNRTDLAHVAQEDLAPDSIGTGVNQGNLTAVADTAMDVVRSVASQGYVRGNFLVIKGAKDKGAAQVALAAGQAVAQHMAVSESSVALAISSAFIETVDVRVDRHQRREARMKGFEGDPCGECGNFTLVRNGTCMKCQTCGATSGCS